MIRGIGPAYGKKLVLAAALGPNAWRFVGLACASKTSQHFLPRRLWCLWFQRQLQALLLGCGERGLRELNGVGVGVAPTARA